MKFSLLFCLLVLLIGCSPDAPVTRFSSWQSSPTEEKLMRGMMAGFQQANPTVPFKYEPIPGNYSEKIQLMIGTHQPPDLFWLKDYTSPAYLRFDVLAPLDDYVAQDSSFHLDDFFPLFRDAFKYKGKYRGFAKDFNAYVLFYNTELFAKAGISSPPTNWQELEETARKLTKDTNGDGKTDQYGLVIEPSPEMIMPFVHQNGGDLQNAAGDPLITEPAFLGALDYYVGLYKKRIATLPSDMGAGWNGDVFGRKNAAMCLAGGWLIPYLKDGYPAVQYKVAPLPQGKNKSTLAFTVAYVIPKEAKRPADAWKMLSYFAGKKGMTEWTSTGLAFPTRQSVARANGFYEHPTYRVFMESVPFARPLLVRYSERWWDEMSASLQSIFYGGADPHKAMEDLSPKLTKLKLND
jgi:multiple sugar transport system substrate-binding protein